ncbi:hypothetical protein PTMSG1_05394 [Pyrenophora teres f. maculata]|nr:hypothetical protein PTMSG1_05394 [Pyrenophora teres f. maculata]
MATFEQEADEIIESIKGLWIRVEQNLAWVASITSVTCGPSREPLGTQLPAMCSAYGELLSTFWTGAKADELLAYFD